MQLDTAFNHFTDIMERCLCPFILLGETARSIIQDEKLQGDGIYAGIKANEFTDTTHSMLRTLASNVDMHLGIEGFKKDENGFRWNFKGVPINVKFIHNKYTFVDNPDFAWYYSENYQVPNSFTKYWEMRETIT